MESMEVCLPCVSMFVFQGLPTDAFEFAATCLQITFQHVESLDRLGLQGKASYW